MAGDFLALHKRADRAGIEAMTGEKFVRIELAPGTNFTRWAKRQGFQSIRNAGYALAYVKVLNAAGELARIERD